MSDASAIDFHDLTARIHGYAKNSADHWDELIVKYLRSEVVAPLAQSQLELSNSLDMLALEIRHLKEKLSEHDAIKESKLEIIDASEAARILKIHKKTLLRLVHQGKIKGEKIGVGHWRFKRDAILRKVG